MPPVSAKNEPLSAAGFDLGLTTTPKEDDDEDEKKRKQRQQAMTAQQDAAGAFALSGMASMDLGLR